MAFRSLIHPNNAPGLIRCIADLNFVRSGLVKVTGAVALRAFIIQSCILFSVPVYAAAAAVVWSVRNG